MKLAPDALLVNGTVVDDEKWSCDLLEWLISGSVVSMSFVISVFSTAKRNRQCLHCVIIINLQCVGSRPSDHYFRSVCLSVCLSVQSFSQPSLIQFRSN